MDITDIRAATGGGSQYVRTRGSSEYISNAADLFRNAKSLEKAGFSLDQVEICNPTPLEIRQSWWPYFNGRCQLNSAVANVASENYAQMDDAAKKYLDGTMTDGQLSDLLKGMISRMTEVCVEQDYPVPGAGGADGEQTIADSLFNEFRKKILDEAINRNYNEGLEHASNGKQGNWVYYNSEYYYKTESAISTLTNTVMDYCHEKGYEDFTITPPSDQWRAKLVDCNFYEDFNGAWENRFGNRNLLFDKDQAPPKDFILFYETGGDYRNAVIVDHVANGAVFDPTDFLSARIWVSYRDANGNLFGSTTIFAYNFDWTPSNAKVVDDLLSFPGLDKDDPLHQYLKNMQVFTLDHFTCRRGLDIRA